MKTKPCKVCKIKYIQERTAQLVCSADCAVALLDLQKTKLLSEEVKLKKKQRTIDLNNLKSKAELIKEAQTIFNRYILFRDKQLGCISCNKSADWTDGKWHAGHFMSTSSHPAIRFNEINVNKQCSQCNYFYHGNLSSYKRVMEVIHGREKVKQLEESTGKLLLTIKEINDIKEEYRILIKELKKDVK